MNARQAAKRYIESSRQTLLELSHRINDNPELRFEEHKACRWLAETLTSAGFEVETGICDMPTAFVARRSGASEDSDLRRI